MIKVSILQQEWMAILNVYVPKNRVSKSETKLIEFQGEIYESIITDRDSNTLLSVIDRSSRKNIDKDKVNLNTTVNHHNLFIPYFFQFCLL